jgi:hypothetical protein
MLFKKKKQKNTISFNAISKNLSKEEKYLRVLGGG